jgi:exosortase H (IPTLxxWG-CTERM-specific)
MDRLKRFYRANDVLIRFYLLFAYLVTLLYLGLHLQTSHWLLADRFPGLIARCVAGLLRVLGQPAQVWERTVSIQGGMSFEVVYQCSGIFLMAIYTAAVLAYPAGAGQKLLGLLLGLPVLFAANVLRLCVLGFVGKYYPGYFDLSHEYLWQGLFIVFVLLLWVLWRDWIVGKPGPLVLDAAPEPGTG